MKYMIDHDEIKQWAEAYNATPQIIDDQQSTGDNTGLRLDFPGDSDESYMMKDNPIKKDVSWEEFFTKFEEDDLAIGIEDTKDSENPSSRYYFIKRSTIEESD